MVYTTTVDQQTLHLAVSGMLWRRSLVMVDEETGTLWSHLLGKAMEGKLQGRRLQSIPSTLTTWQAWKQNQPATTVIHLSRTANRFDTRFYRRPQLFVFGWVHEGEQAYAARFDTLLKHPLLNLTTEGTPLVLTFDPDSTSANLFLRQVSGRTLRMKARSSTRMEDEQTGTVWNSQTGTALSGPLKGQQLSPRVGIVSYRYAWSVFHPDSQLVGPHTVDVPAEPTPPRP